MSLPVTRIPAAEAAHVGDKTHGWNVQVRLLPSHLPQHTCSHSLHMTTRDVLILDVSKSYGIGPYTSVARIDQLVSSSLFRPISWSGLSSSASAPLKAAQAFEVASSRGKAATNIAQRAETEQRFLNVNFKAVDNSNCPVLAMVGWRFAPK